MPSAIVLLSGGAEEMETVISVDVLRRGGVRDLGRSPLKVKVVSQRAKVLGPGVKLNG